VVAELGSEQERDGLLVEVNGEAVDAADVAVLVDDVAQDEAIDHFGQGDQDVAHTADVIVAEELDLGFGQGAGDADGVADDKGGGEGFLLGFHLGDGGGGIGDVDHGGGVDLLIAGQVEQELDSGVGQPGVQDVLFLQQFLQAFGIDPDLSDRGVGHRR